MAGIAFWFEDNDTDVFSGRTVDLDAWRYAIKAGGITKARCFNSSSLDLFFDAGFDFEVIGSSGEDFNTWINNHSSERLIGFETQWSCPINGQCFSTLDHSTVDWYIFGPSFGIDNNLPIEYIYLPQNGIAALHSVHIASAVMLRRWECS